MKVRSDIKILIFSISVLVLIIISGIIIRAYLQKSTDKLTLEIKNIENSVNSNNWDDAHKAILELDRDWEKTESKWTLFTNHHEIDNITVTLKNSSEYIRVKDKAQTLSSLSSLKHYLSHIPDMEKLSLKNIF